MNDDHDDIAYVEPEPIVTGPVAMPRMPAERMAPIHNRFLFVDVAAQRAKQLRRGALPRLADLRPNPDTGERPAVNIRIERVAVEEVEQGLVVFEIQKPQAEPTA